MPTAAPNAAERFISGKVMASPDMASGPTPWPIKMLSIMLYSEAAVIAMMAGRAYCISSLPTGFVPSSSVACLLSIMFTNLILCKVTACWLKYIAKSCKKLFYFVSRRMILSLFYNMCVIS